MWPMIPASDRFSFCLLMVLLAFHRSKTPCRPARPSPAGEGPGPGRRAGPWPPERSAAGAGPGSPPSPGSPRRAGGRRSKP